MKTALLILLAALAAVSGVSVFAANELLVVPATLAIALMAVLAALDHLQRSGKLNVRSATAVATAALLISTTGIANLPRRLVSAHPPMARDIPGAAPK